MKKLAVLIGLVGLAGLLFFSQCGERSNDQQTELLDSTKWDNYGGYESQQKWGEHIVSFAGCNDCHTPKKMTSRGPVIDSTLLLSGHPAKVPDPEVNRKDMESKGLVVTSGLTAWVGPWGISYSANLTPHSTGLATWKEQQFIYAIREGKYKGLPDSRPLLPPMPWQEIRNMTDDELKAVFAYLQSIKPIDNAVPPPKPPVSAPRQ